MFGFRLWGFCFRVAEDANDSGSVYTGLSCPRSELREADSEDV